MNLFFAKQFIFSTGFLSILLITNSFAQNSARVHTANVNAWFMYFGNHKFSDHFGAHVEVQERRHDFASDNQQLLLRFGLDYYSKGNNRVTVGYAFVNTFPYGEFAVDNSFPEHRVWEQYLISHPLGKGRLAHRYRLEQRMIGNVSTGAFADGRFENRFRYMAKFTHDISKGKRPLFLAIYDEIFVNFGKEVAYNVFDQNRLYGAFGFALSNAFRIELGYLYQLIQLRSLDLVTTPRNKIENNHTFQLGVFSNLSLKKSK